ncbi:hypothetical protein ACFQX6_24170 [Streptosporangium lutulentum]
MEWTIGELVERASAALASGARLNGRVRDVPNERLIRWYSTIGLLDPRRPAEAASPCTADAICCNSSPSNAVRPTAGPSPRYRRSSPGRPTRSWRPSPASRRHRPRRWPRQWRPGLHAPASGPSPLRPGRTAFRPGRTSPAGTAPLPVPPPVPAAPAAASAPSPAAASPLSAVAGSAPATSTTEEPRPSALPAIVHGVRLATGVTLLLDGGGRTPSPDDLAEIAATSGALLAVLRERGLISPEGRQS